MKIQELLTDGSKWIKHQGARNVKNLAVAYTDPTAVKWCLLAALIRCYGYAEKTVEIDRYIIANTNYGGITGFNDAPETKFEDIRKLIEFLDV